MSFGLTERNLQLQPWRYLLEVAHTLAKRGHEVCLLSDGWPHLPERAVLAGFPVTRLSNISDHPVRGNPILIRAVESLEPDLALWHLGSTSFLRLSTLRRLPIPVVGLFTSPLYRPGELFRLGIVRLLRGWRLTAVHLVGLLVPGLLMRRALHHDILISLVVECDTTRDRLIERGLPAGQVRVIRPGIDATWFEGVPSPAERLEIRREMGYAPDDVVVAFFGPPTPLRGLPALLQAVAVVQKEDPAIKLLALSRQRDGELAREQQAIEALVERLGAGPWACIETGFLPREHVIRTLAGCDLVALPFEVVPSDVPLSVLEAMALGLPVITTDVACLPELVPDGTGLRVPPADARALAAALLTLAASREQRERLGEQARERALSWAMPGPGSGVWDETLRTGYSARGAV